MFGSSLFHSLVTCRKKQFFKYPVLQGYTSKVLGCLWEIPACGSKWWICDGLPGWKKLVEQIQSPHPSSLLEVLELQFLIQPITRRDLTGSCYY